MRRPSGAVTPGISLAWSLGSMVTCRNLVPTNLDATLVHISLSHDQRLKAAATDSSASLCFRNCRRWLARVTPASTPRKGIDLPVKAPVQWLTSTVSTWSFRSPCGRYTTTPRPCALSTACHPARLARTVSVSSRTLAAGPCSRQLDSLRVVQWRGGAAPRRPDRPPAASYLRHRRRLTEPTRTAVLPIESSEPSEHSASESSRHRVSFSWATASSITLLIWVP